jgi:hypothetical protein
MRNTARNEQIRAEVAAIRRHATVAGIKRRALAPPRGRPTYRFASIADDRVPFFHPSAKRQIAAASVELLHQTRIKNLKKADVGNVPKFRKV